MSEEVVVVGRIIDGFGPNVRVVSVHSGLHALLESYMNFLVSGYHQKMIEYPLFDGLRPVLNSAPLLYEGVLCEQAEGGRDLWLDGFSTSTEESHYRQQSWHARTCWRRGQFCRSVALIVWYLRKRGQEVDVDSLVVWFQSMKFIATVSYPCTMYLWCLEERDEWVLLSRSVRLSEVLCVPHAAWNIQMQRILFRFWLSCYVCGLVVFAQSF